MARDRSTQGNHDWLSMVRSSGLVVSLPVLNDVFRDGPEPVEPAMQRRFTRAWSRFQAGLERGREGAHREWIDFILRELLGLRDHLLKGSDIPAHLSHVLADYDQTLRPDAALLDDEGNPLLLVGVVEPEQGLDRREARSGAWRASPFVKLDRLMREAGAKLGLLTNGHEFRLLHAPPGLGAAWLAWRAVDWSDESEMLDGFHTLLRAERFYGDEKASLQKLVDGSGEKQLELTDQLGDQVRQALEVFLRAVDRADRAAGGTLLSGMEHPQVYEMCLFTMMRMVFILYAEESYLLPHGEVIYDEAYGLTHLWQQLSEQQRNAPESLTDSFDAWPRLLATFRLVHGGCPHPDLNMRPYGGHLFDPNRFPPLEDPRLQVNNHVIFLLMQKLLFATARVGGQRGSHRLSYSALDIEQIGTVYEGLIAYTVRRTPDKQTMVVFDGKNDAMRPLSELEAVTPADLKKYVIQQTGWTEKQAEKALEAMQQPSQDVPPPAPGIDGDLHERLLPYRPVIKLDETIPGGHLYVAHESGLRKGQGVYYTPKWITSYIVERTLEPLVYELDHGSLGEGPHEGSPASSAGQPRSAHAVLGDNEVLEGSAERRRHVVPATEGDRPGAVPEGPDAVLEGPVDRSPDVVPGATEPGPAVQVPATEGDRPAVDQSDEGMESADQSPSVPHTTAGRPSAGPSNTVMDSDAGTPSSREAETSAVSSGEGPLEPADAGEGPHEWTPPGRMGGVTRSAHVNQPSKGPESADQSPSVPQTAAGRPSAGPSNDATDAVASPSRRIKPPRDILDLKVCDPAMGSGAFLVQACRYLADRLVESWERLAADQPDAALTLPYGDIADGSPGEIILPDDHEEAVTWARRFVAEHCLYGVDINPLAVELAKMSLWLITLAKDRAFEFLDHKLRPGNSLIGSSRDEFTTYPLSAWKRSDATDKGADAALKVISKAAAADAKRVREFQLSFSGARLREKIAETADEIRQIEQMDTLDPEAKEAAFKRLIEDDADWQNIKRAYDAWCALWFWPVDADTQPEDVPLPGDWEALLNHILGQGAGLHAIPEKKLEQWAETVKQIRNQADYRCLHWELEFPDAFSAADTGFDAMVMNPPWERIKLQENEFFEARDQDISGAPNAAARKKLIAALPETKRWLYEAYADAKRAADFSSHFIREGGHHPLSAVGDINTYPIFAEHARTHINGFGGVGMVIPSGIATDYFTSGFFRDLMESGALRALYDFENSEGIFPGVHRSYKFSLLIMAGASRDARVADFAFFMTRRAHLEDDWRHFTLSDDDIALLNPNTRTCPIFRSKRDAELTKGVYRRHPVLIREVHDDDGEQIGEENPWGIRFFTMFHMANDSGLFRTREDLETNGFMLRQPGNHFEKGNEVWLPLYEGKMFSHYDHRAASVIRNEANLNRPAQPLPTRPEEHADPAFSPMPEYWVAEGEVAHVLPETNPHWLLAIKGVTASTNERTAIGSLIPYVAIHHNAPLLFLDTADVHSAAVLLSIWNSFALDYTLRQKCQSTYLSFFFIEQMPVPDVDKALAHSSPLVDAIIELTYTAWDIKAFAEDMGYDGPPYVWDEERRAQLRAQLDALYFHLYGIDRDDVDYIMETFPIVKRKDIAAHGFYRTKELILKYYDDQAAGHFDTWHGPAELKEPMFHSEESRP